MRRSLLPAVPLALASALFACGDRSPGVAEAAKAAGAKLISYDYGYGIGEHTDGRVKYPTNPPTNGPHAFDWAADGNYAGVEPPTPEQIVHAQEHGRIVIQYRRGLPQAQIARLEALFEEAPRHVLLAENRTDMPCDVAATAWSRGILCKRLDDAALDALRAFRDAYVDKGPELVA